MFFLDHVRAQTWQVLLFSSLSVYAGDLRREQVSTWYLEGRFEPAIAHLEEVIKDHRLSSLEDSVFAFKHLGVMYSADPATQPQGTHYLHILLTLKPTLQILDMYALDMHRIIEHRKQRDAAVKMPSRFESGETDWQDAPITDWTDASEPYSVPAPVADSREGQAGLRPPKERLYWVMGGAVALGVAATLFLFSQEEPDTEDRVITIRLDK